tara:strand:- start:106 stop:600 length:495 start_codon:yes stop_codon:yes gene_type:complete
MESDKKSIVKTIADYIAPGGRIAISENILYLSQRLYKLADLKLKKNDLFNRVAEAEEAIYQRSTNPHLAYSEVDLQSIFLEAGFKSVGVERQSLKFQRYITKKDIDTWFSAGNNTQPTYAYHLSKSLELEDINSLHEVFLEDLVKKNVTWTTNRALIFARAGDK